MLHNKINGEELKAAMQHSDESRVTISFYRYHRIADPGAFRDELYLAWDRLGVLGRTYVAHEGINAQLSLPAWNFDAFQQQLYAIDWLDGVRLNVAVEDDGKSFFKLGIKVRPKIVADGLDDQSFDPSNTGVHLNAASFNQLTDRDDVVIVDMRNHYESEVGHFEGAITPDVDTFRDSLPIVEEILRPHQDKHIVMYCTGGIRCEKASAYFKHRGFDQVYQLEGGIIKYAHDVKTQGLPNKFRGKNFVFDERLGERISDDIIAQCHQCGAPCDTHINCANQMCNLLFIQCEACAQQHQGCCSDTCQEIIHLPKAVQKDMRKGQQGKPRMFSKGRFVDQ
jgi:UPF0176 protein